MSLIATGPKTLIQLASVVGMCSWCAYQLSFGNAWALVGPRKPSGNKSGSRERRISCGHSAGQLDKGDKPMTTIHRRPQFQAPIYNLPSARVAERENDQMPTENLSELLGRVSENSASQIDGLVGDFGRLREKLRTDAERIQREIEEYSRLSEQVMQLTKTISESLEKVRAAARVNPGDKHITLEKPSLEI